MALKSNTLSIGSYYDVICSDVKSDSWIFSVQLKSNIEKFNDMTFKLQNCELKNLQEKPLLGMPCITRFSEDDQLYRAIILDIKQTSCQVAYVDYGNTDEVPFENIYEIPSEFLEQKIFAMQFTLSGLHELEPIDDHIKTAFKNLILNKELRLNVMPLEGPPLVQYCKLYDDDIDILNLMKNIKNEKCVYSKPKTIKTGDVVIICYVESPKKFYVQKVNDIKIFEEIMDKLFLYYTKLKSPIKILEKNTACVAKFENAWYRAQIISIKNDNALVKFVDFGNEYLIPIEQLFSICEEFVKLSPQAIKCCLKGFENTEDFSESTITQLQIFAESENGNRRHFKCQVYKIENNECIVNLIDETMPELNLMKKLYKLSMPFNTYVELITNSNTGEITQNQQSKYSSNKENLSTNNSNNTVIRYKEKYSQLSNNTFKINNLKLQTHKTVMISWWISPHKFYIQINEEIQLFKNMMKNIQSFYKKRPSIRSMENKKNKIENFQINDDCIIYDKKDKLFYRAKILASKENIKKYKVKLVDIGCNTIVDENSIWYVEEDFTKLPIMSYECSFADIVLKFNLKEILNCIEKHVQPHKLFNCEFIQKDLENDLYYVELKSNDVSLKELLINDGAFSIINEDIDVKLLCGQKIKAKILAFKDLLHFEIEIEGCDLKLLCSYNDIKFMKSNPNLSIEFKIAYEGTSCIIDILDVTNDNILMVQPLIPLFNINIPKQIICNYPIINRIFDVNIAYIETSNIINVHPKIRQDSLNKLLDDMFEYYETEGKIMEEKTIGSLCAVKSYDENWYRARIISSKNDTITVLYVDYGNTEDIENNEKNIKVLENEFIEISAFAIKIFRPFECDITSSESTDEDMIDKIRLLIENKSRLKLNIIELYKSSWIAEILIKIDQNLINILNENYTIEDADFEYVKNLIDNYNEQLILNSVDKEFYGGIYNNGEESLNEQETNDINGVGKEFYGESLNEQEKNNTSEINESDNQFQSQNEDKSQIENNMRSAYLSYCDNPGRFFLHLKENYEDFMKMQDDIQTVALSLPPLMDIVTGELCIALCSGDNTWYRAKIIDNKLMTIQYIDYGNTDVLTDSSFIKKMDKTFNDIEPFAIPCSLPICPNRATDWVDQANLIFNDMYDKELHFKYISKVNNNYIDLIIDGQNVAEKLIADGLALRLEVIKCDGESLNEQEKNNTSEINESDNQFQSQNEDKSQIENNMRSAYLSYCDNPGRFFLHLKENYEDFMKMQDDIQTVALSLPPLMDIVTGELCIALCSGDNTWYRAKIIDNKLMTIQYIDYGNTDVLTDSSFIKKMDKTFNDIEPFAIPCSLPICPNRATDWVDQANLIFNDMYDKELHFKYISKVNNNYIDLIIDGQNVAENLIADGLALRLEVIKCDGESLNEQEKNNTSEINESDNQFQNQNEDKSQIENNMRSAYLSYCDNPGRFFLHLKENYEDFMKMQDDIQTVALSLPPLMDIVTGELCIALCSGDNTWYRAKIIDNKLMTIQYIDYGNTDVLTDSSFIKKMDKTFNDIEPFAIPCSLPICPNRATDWVDQANLIFNDMYDKELHFKYISKVNNNYIDLIIDGQNVAEKLIADGLALRLEVIKYDEKCFVSHINNLSDFYIQLEKSMDRLKLIAEYLSQADNFPHLENFVKGDICAAISLDDGVWYRAMLIEKFDDDINNIEYCVLFVDYGNTSIVKDVCQISDEIANLPHVSTKCSLLMPDYILEWSKSAEDKFFELSGMGETLLTVELVEFLEDYTVVNLFVENTNILEELEILCEKKESNIDLIEETFEKNHKNENDLKINDYKKEENNNENVVLGNDELDTTNTIKN